MTHEIVEPEPHSKGNPGQGWNQLPRWIQIPFGGILAEPSAWARHPHLTTYSQINGVPLSAVHTTGGDTRWPDKLNWHPGLFVG